MHNSDYDKRLPYEMWRECFTLLSLLDHKNLATTCRLFHDISLPFVFKSICFSSVDLGHHEPNKLSSPCLAERINHFYAIASDPRRAPLVRSCSITYVWDFQSYTDGPMVAALRAAYGSFIKAFVQYIPKLTNLRRIDLELGRRVDKKILAVLASLPRLDSVTFTSAQFAASSLEPRLPLKHLVIDNTKYAWCHGIDPDPTPDTTLLNLFSASHLETLESRTWAYTPRLFRALRHQGRATSLVGLTVQVLPQDVDAFYSFLAVCPNLLSLFVRVGPATEAGRQEHILPPLPQSVIPRLRRLRGSDVVIKSFVPGRPLSDIQLVREEWSGRVPYRVDMIQDIMPTISQSTGNVTDLYIHDMSPAPLSFSLIAAHLPGLRRLCLKLGEIDSSLYGNPNDYDMERVIARKDVLAHMGESYVLELAHNAEMTLLPLHLHAEYMELLHWIALKQIKLPIGLEVLELTTDLPLDFQYIDRHDFSQRPYTLWEAGYLCNVMSIHYPGMQELAVVKHGDQSYKFSWLKTKRVGWTMSVSQGITTLVRRSIIIGNQS